MISVWIIGFILTLLAIYLFKGSRYYRGYYRGDEEAPVLKMWGLIFMLIISIVPFLNIVMGFLFLFVWSISVFAEKDWKYVKNSKFKEFLSRDIM